MYVNIQRVLSTPPENAEDHRVSSLELAPDGLRVVGNLPHGYVFEPKSVAGALALKIWLTNWIGRQASQIL